MEHTSDLIPITIQWMSGDMYTILYDSCRGLYWLKRAILTMAHNDANPFQLVLHTVDEDGSWKEYDDTTPMTGPIHLYAVVRQPIIHERLDFIYPTDGMNLWRFTYNVQEDMKQISFFEKNDSFCGINGYVTANRQREPIPWVHTMEAFLEPNLVIDEQIRLNFIHLWKTRRQ